MILRPGSLMARGEFPSFFQNFADPGSSLDNWTFARTGEATWTPTTAGVLATAATGVPRLPDHVRINGVWVPKGYLGEGAGTNLILQSNGFDTTWTNSASIGTAAAGTSPDGTANAWRITDNSAGGTGQPYLVQAATITNAAYTVSIFAKADQLSFAYIRTVSFTNTGSSFFDLANGVVGSSAHTSTGIASVGNGWYRCWAVFTPGVGASGTIRIGVAESNSNLNVDLDGTSSILVFGAQLELGTFPSSYTPTTTDAVTRNADSASRTGVGLAAGVVVEGFTAPGVSGTQVLWQRDDGTADNVQRLIRNASREVRQQVVTAGVTVADVLLGTVADSTSFKAAMRFETDNVNGALNGVLGTPDTSAAMPTVTTERLCGSSSAGSEWFGFFGARGIFNTAPDSALVGWSA